jgi:hypothetical protein
MQQQAVALALRFQLLGCEPGPVLAPLVRRLDLRFDRFAFPAPCHGFIISRALKAHEWVWFGEAPSSLAQLAPHVIEGFLHRSIGWPNRSLDDVVLQLHLGK